MLAAPAPHSLVSRNCRRIAAFSAQAGTGSRDGGDGEGQGCLGFGLRTQSGAYANVVMIERELRRRGISNDGVISNVWRRELLTRACHAARSGGEGDIEGSRLSFRQIAHAHLQADVT